VSVVLARLAVVTLRVNLSVPALCFFTFGSSDSLSVTSGAAHTRLLHAVSWFECKIGHFFRVEMRIRGNRADVRSLCDRAGRARLELMERLGDTSEATTSGNGRHGPRG
jgi:hypothetical protein